MSNKLLIVEESLKDLKGHWFELIKAIRDSAINRGWTIDVACHRHADHTITNTFSAFPVFKHAKYLESDKKKGWGERYYGFLFHNIRSLRDLWPLLNSRLRYDMVFVSTVLVHHLIMWYIIMLFHPQRPKKLTLFFITNPGVWDEQKKEVYFSKDSIVMSFCIRLFRQMVKSGTVVLAVGTKGTKEEFEKLCRLPFEFMAQPVTIGFTRDVLTESKPTDSSLLTLSCLGFARHEKGSDILKAAIEKILTNYPHWPVKFILQWTDNFTLPDGSICEPGPILEFSSRVILIKRALTTLEYQHFVKQTDCMILPYRNASYYARVSQIATEAVCLGIPIIYTRGGWLEETILEFGSGVGIEEQSVDELVKAIEKIINQIRWYKAEAEGRIIDANNFYSPDNFTGLLLDKQQDKGSCVAVN